MNTLWQDIRFAVRMLAKNPGFTLIAIISLAIGTGANTTIFSLVNSALLRPLPQVEDEARLVDLNRSTPDGDEFRQTSYPDYQYFRDHNDVFDGLAAYTLTPVSVNAGGEAEKARGLLVTGNYFDVLGVRLARGRGFTTEEDRTPGAVPVVIIGYDFWQRRFGGAGDVLGKQLALNGHSFTIIGVAPQGFKSPFIYFAPEVFVPAMMQAQVMPGSDLLGDRTASWLGVRGRLRAGVEMEQAQAAMTVLAQGLAAESPEANREGVRLHPIGHVPGEVRSAVVGFMATLTGIVTLVLLIACTNVAGMFLARASTRRREFAIRTAIGATRVRLIRQLLKESVLLFLCGGALGVLLAIWMNDLILAFKPAGTLAVDFDLALDWRVLSFTLAVSLLTGIIFGLAPALAAAKPDVIPELKDGAPGGGIRASRVRGLFVVGQVAISLVLLVAAALCIRSLSNASRIDPGFEADGVQLASVNLQTQGYDETRGREFYRRLVESVESIPGVEVVSLARAVPLSGLMFGNSVRIEGFEPPAGQPPLFMLSNTVGENYLHTLGVSLLAGRDLRLADDKNAPRVSVINETMARRFFGGAREAIGKRFKIISSPRGNRAADAGGGDATVEIVGVVEDGRYYTLGEEAQPFFYLPFAQSYHGAMTLHLRTKGDPSAALAAVRSETRALDPNLPLVNVMPMTQAISFSLIPLRLAATLVGILGLVGLLLATIGIYGVVSYSVSSRTREIGIRLALGAQTLDVLRVMMKQGIILTSIGIVVGLGAAFALTRFLSSLLYGVSTTDPLTFVGVQLLLASVALVACYLPARRATKVDPMIALRYE
ncbi:ABC transporter permease [soil metagenome]